MNWAFAKETGVGSYLARRLMWRFRKLNPWTGWQFRLPSGDGIRLFPQSSCSADIYCTGGFVDWGSEQLLLNYLGETQPEGVCYDVGANMGYYSVLMASTGRRVFAFEPDARNHPLLLAQQNKNIVLVPKAVGQSEGIVRLTLGDESSVSHLTAERECAWPEVAPGKVSAGIHLTHHGCETEATAEVECVSLDGFRAQRPAGEIVDVVKMDIEGFEIEGLEGAADLVQHDQPVFLIEFNVEPGRPNNFAALAEFLARHRYRVFAMIRENRGRFYHTTLQEIDAANLSSLSFKMLFLVPEKNWWFARKSQESYCFETMRLAIRYNGSRP